MVRQPVVQGQFYEEDFSSLNKQLEEAFSAKLGPGELPLKRTDEALAGIIVPHAGYSFSGPCAAWAYKEVAESHFPKTYILLGFSHQGLGSGISIEDWKTPLGLVKTDKDLAIHLKENTSLSIDEEPHLHEHSLEVQLPFLQFSSKDRLKELKIVAISVARDLDFSVLGKELHEATKGKDVVYIVSSDFTHYGPNYGYVPFTLEVPERLNALDGSAIGHIQHLDIPGFSKLINETHVTICGYYPILLLMRLLSLRGNKPKGSLLMHYTSGDILGDFSNSVSYASICFR